MPLVIIENFNHFGQIGTDTVAKLDQVVRSTANEIRSEAAGNAPVDTHALQQSGYVSDDRGSDYGARAELAASLLKGANAHRPVVIVPEEKPDAKHEAVIGFAVGHAMDNEFGTIRMPARPFLVPAVEHAAPRYFQRVGDALDDTS